MQTYTSFLFKDATAPVGCDLADTMGLCLASLPEETALPAEALDLACHAVTPLLELDNPVLRRFARIVLRSAKEAMRETLRAKLRGAATCASVLTPRQLKLAQQYMAEHLGRKLLVAEVAAACGLSASHFSRGFRCTCGVTPHCWLLQRRVKRAKELLESSHLTIPEIALECGFAHRVPFSKAFARVTGSGPSRWRREHHTVLWRARPA